MKHEESSRQTRLQLADALKKRMAHKPLSKVTVSELVADCNINRKTFYYHFEDIYGLFKWMLEQEAIEVVKQFNLLADLREALQFAADYILSNSYVLNAAYDAIGRDGLKRFFYQDFVALAENLIEGVEQQEGVRLTGSFRAFLCDFYTDALANLLLSWAQKPETVTRDNEQVLAYTQHLLESSLPEIIRSAKKKGAGFVEA